MCTRHICSSTSRREISICWVDTSGRYALRGLASYLLLNTGVSPKEEHESSLSQILEDSPYPRYYLSPKACLGILRRSKVRGKPLPKRLEAALLAQAGLSDGEDIDTGVCAYHINQRNEGIDLHGVAGALMATQNMQMQTFVAGFSPGAGSSAGSVGYTEDVAPTLKSADGGNTTPAVLRLYENHGIDSRYKGPFDVLAYALCQSRYRRKQPAAR